MAVPSKTTRALAKCAPRAPIKVTPPKTVCCLLAAPPSQLQETPSCTIRESSWPLFAKLRRSAQSDVFFDGCERFVLRQLYSWEPSEIVQLCCAFSRAGSPACAALLRAALFRADRLVESLNAGELIKLLEVCSLHGIREHDPRKPDVFLMASPRLIVLASTLEASEIGRLCTIWRQLNLSDLALFDAFGLRLLLLFGGWARSADRLIAPPTSTSGCNLEKSDSLSPRKKSRTARSSSRKKNSNASVREWATGITATMSYLTACGRLNVFTEYALPLFEIVAPLVRERGDVGRLTTLTQLSVKFGFLQSGESDQVLHAVCTLLQKLSPAAAGKNAGYTSQVVYGQLLLALVFNEAPCDTRDNALLIVLSGVHAAFEGNPAGMDEQLTRQLWIAEIACRLERPGVMAELEKKGILPFLQTRTREHKQNSALPMTKCSSKQHWQVSGALRQLGVRHRLEERVLPYVADIRILNAERHLIEIDGPLHFIGRTVNYDMKSRLKHRLLVKQGWKVHHIAWYDWPEHHHSRVTYLTKLLRSQAPAADDLSEYRPLSIVPVIPFPALEAFAAITAE